MTDKGSHKLQHPIDQQQSIRSSDRLKFPAARERWRWRCWKNYVGLDNSLRYHGWWWCWPPDTKINLSTLHWSQRSGNVESIQIRDSILFEWRLSYCDANAFTKFDNRFTVCSSNFHKHIFYVFWCDDDDNDEILMMMMTTTFL